MKIKTIIKSMMMTLAIYLVPAMQIVAADVTSVTNPINNLKTLICSVIAAVGGIIIVWGIFSLASALMNHDSSSKTQALITVGAGAMMSSISLIVGFVQG